MSGESFTRSEYGRDAETDPFVARKLLSDFGFAIVDDAIYEGSEQLGLIIEPDPTHVAGMVVFQKPDGTTCEPFGDCPNPPFEIPGDHHGRGGSCRRCRCRWTRRRLPRRTTTGRRASAEHVSTVTVEITNGKTFAVDQTVTLTFSGTATQGTHYSVSPGDADTNTAGHQVVLVKETASVEVTVTATGNDTADRNRTVTVTGALGSKPIGTEDITILDDETTNTGATGQPLITGTARVGGELTATKHTIADMDGLPATFPGDYTFAWVRVDTETPIGTDSNSYTVLSADVGNTIRVDVSFTDGAGNSEGPLASAETAVVVANNAPMLDIPIPDQSAPIGTAFSYTVPANTFSDADNDPLTYTATKDDGTPLPTWLSFDHGTRTFSGTPPTTVVIPLPLKVTASDGYGGSVSDMFDINAIRVPFAPTGLTATASGTTAINLSWTAPPNNGGSVITGYKIEVSSNGGTSWIDHVVNTNSTSTTYDHTGLAPGTTRHYRVSAINSVGTGAASNVDNATTDAAATTCLAPTLTGRMQIWTGTVTVGAYEDGGTVFLYGFGPSFGALDDTQFSVGTNDYTVDLAQLHASASTLAGRLEFSLTSALAAADSVGLTLHVCDAAFAFADAELSLTPHTYGWPSAGLDWSSDTSRTLYLSVPSDDTTAPSPKIAAVASDGVVVAVVFDEALAQPAPTLSASVFTLTADGVELDIQNMSFGADTLLFNLASGTTIYAGETVRLSYDKTVAGADALEDAAGNEVASFTDFAVTNNSTVVNTPPMIFFDDETLTTMEENTLPGVNIAGRVTATDADNDPLIFTLEGTDAASFDLVTLPDSARLRTKTGVTYDYETKSSYSVMVKVDDGHGGTATASMTINVTDVNEPPARPAAPSVSSVADSTTSLLVTWTAPENTGRPAIDHYDLRYREGTSGGWTDGPQDVDGPSATIMSLTAAPPTYQVQVRATNDEGDGPWSPPGRIRTTPELTLTVEAVEATVTEGEPVRYRIRMSRRTSGAVVQSSFRYKGNFVRNPNSVVTSGINSHGGRLSWVVSYDTLDDVVDEPNGKFTVTIGKPDSTLTGGADLYSHGEAYTVGSPSAATVTILDNDGAGAPPPTTPPIVSAEDARVAEGPGAELVFPVTLDRAPVETARIDWQTIDGANRTGATAGQDYVAASGTLEFRPGQTSKTIRVAVLDDSHDEGNEVMLLYLSGAEHAVIDDALLKGTIENSDPLPRALMGRFGRTATVHVVEQVQERIEAPRETGIEARFAGRPVGRELVRDLAVGFLTQLGASSGAPMSTADGMDGPVDPMGSAAGVHGGLDRSGHLGTGLGGGNMLTGSAFELNHETRRGGVLSFWSRGAQSQFAGREGELSLDGRVRTTMFGADYAKGRLVTGLSLSHSRGLGGYTGVDVGEVTSSVTGLYPWLGYKISDRITLWGVTGYGKGALTLTPGAGATLKSGLSMAMAAGGLRGDLADSVLGGFGLAFKADALWVGTGIEGVAGPGGNLAATEAAVTRVRTGLEASRGYRFQRGLSLQPSLEVGLRRDGGDAERGTGLDVAAGTDRIGRGDRAVGQPAGADAAGPPGPGVPGPGCVSIVWLQPDAVDAARLSGEADPVLGRTGRKRRPGALGPGDDGGDGGRRSGSGRPSGGRARLRDAGRGAFGRDAEVRHRGLRARARLPAGLRPDGGAGRRHALRAGHRCQSPGKPLSGNCGAWRFRPAHGALVEMAPRLLTSWGCRAQLEGIGRAGGGRGLLGNRRHEHPDSSGLASGKIFRNPLPSDADRRLKWNGGQQAYLRHFPSPPPSMLQRCVNGPRCRRFACINTLR